MAIVKFPDTVLSVQSVGIVGRPLGAGCVTAGLSWAGDDNPFSGIYQRRPRPTGQILVKMKHYRSPNPRTDSQQAWRAYFKDVLAFWHALPPEFREYMKLKRYPTGMGGWNRFARLYMSRKPTDAGIMRAGLCSCGGLTI